MPYVRFQNMISNNNDPEARMDLVEKTASIVWSMPLLAFFVVIGFFCSAKDGYGRNIKYIFIVGSIPMILTMLSAVAITHRYIIDFLPLMYIFSCISILYVNFNKRIQILFILILLFLSIFINYNLTYQYQQLECWGVSSAYKK